MTAQHMKPLQPATTPWPDAPSDFGQGPVTMWMAPIGNTLQPNTPLQDAIQLMLASHGDHLVVCDAEGELFGLVCYRTLIGLVANGAYPGPKTIESLIDRNPVRVARSSSFVMALRRLDPPEVTCVVVVEKGRPVGLISETHLAHPTLALVESSL